MHAPLYQQLASCCATEASREKQHCSLQSGDGRRRPITEMVVVVVEDEQEMGPVVIIYRKPRES